MDRFSRPVRLVLLVFALGFGGLAAVALSAWLPASAMMALTFSAISFTFGYLFGKLRRWW